MNKIYSPSQDRFNINGDTITIRRFPVDNVATFLNNQLNLQNGKGLLTPFAQSNVTVTDDLSYPYTRVGEHEEGGVITLGNGLLKYHKSNFSDFKDGAIRFSVKKAECVNDYSYISLKGFQGCSAGTYSINLEVKDSNDNITALQPISFTLASSTELAAQLQNAIQASIESTFQVPRPVSATLVSDEDILLQTPYTSGVATISKLLVSSGDTFLSSHFTSVTDELVFSAPEHDSVVFSLVEDNSSNNKILFVHETDGNLHLYMWDSTGTYYLHKNLCAWNWTNNEFTEFELNFDSSTATFLANGEFITSFEMVGRTVSSELDVENIVRATHPNTNLVLVGQYANDNRDCYRYQRFSNFDGNLAIGNYEFDIPITTSSGSTVDEDVTVVVSSAITTTTGIASAFNNAFNLLNYDIAITCYATDSTTIEFRTSGSEDVTGVDSFTVSSRALEANFAANPVSGDYVEVPVYGDAYDYNLIAIFNKKQHCGAYTTSSIDSYDGTGYVDFNYGQLSAFDDKTLTLSGSGSFNFKLLDGSLVMATSNSIAEFKTLVEAIDYNTTSTLSFETANDCIFRVTFLASDSILTGLSFNPGTAVYDEDDPYNFEDIYMWVRRSLGYPQVACELTDEQIYDALLKAVDKYNRYRNWSESLQIESLESQTVNDLTRGESPKEGKYFILPPNIDENDIIDIFFQPRYSCAWFGAGNDFMNNVVSQTFFARTSDMSISAADYYIYRSSLNDISNLLGTQISWRTYNHHLFITPNNLEWLDQFAIGIKFRSTLSVDEIRNSYLIKDLTLAYSMITLSLIRGTFTSGVPMGDTIVQLNAETLMTQGTDLRDKTIGIMQKEQRPLFMVFT